MTSSTSISANIRAAMARKRVTQEHIAAALGVTQQTVSRRIGNDAQDWPLGQLRTVATALEVDLVDLLPPEVIPT